MTEIKRKRSTNRARVLGYKLSPWEVQALVRSHRQVHPDTLRRAMGADVEAPHFNPRKTRGGGQTMATRGRTAAQRRATARMIAANRAARRGRGRRRRNPEQLAGLEQPRAPARHAPTFRERLAADAATYAIHDTPSSHGALQGPVVAGQTRVYKKKTGGKHLARFVRRLGPLRPGQRRYMWVDADGNAITGKRWQHFHRGGRALDGTRPSKAKARRRRGSGRRKGRTAAQRRATARMLAANRARKRRRGGSARRMPQRALMRVVVGRMKRGRVTFRYKTRKGSKGYTLKSRGRGKVPTRAQFKAALARMPKGRVVVKVAGVKGESRGYTIRNPRGRGGRAMRRNPSRRRRRNPMDIMGTAKRTVAAAVPAVVGGALVSVLDAKVLGTQPLGLRVVGKLLAATAAGAFLRSRPDMAKLIQGAIIGSLGAELAAKFIPGTNAPTTGYLIPASQGMAALVDASGATNTMPSLHGLSGPTIDYNIG